ncbi:hypothetical protein BXY66_3867 [Shimia isoporae]|uniref:Uncharacterized protein n=1 Tax=Shimia isoporae TaxID=647720 RepID=A0A4R1N0Q0_9RHOB|nr:hypothetical protein [Shimia isoporae]TCK99365.1 hypothetical protein BXY66_3867 [Shimia isoporae]
MAKLNAARTKAAKILAYRAHAAGDVNTPTGLTGRQLSEIVIGILEPDEAMKQRLVAELADREGRFQRFWKMAG